MAALVAAFTATQQPPVYADALRRAGCCDVCIGRLYGVPVALEPRTAWETAVSEFIGSTAPAPTSGVCVVCVGLLQDSLVVASGRADTAAATDASGRRKKKQSPAPPSLFDMTGIAEGGPTTTGAVAEGGGDGGGSAAAAAAGAGAGAVAASATDAGTATNGSDAAATASSPSLLLHLVGSVVDSIRRHGYTGVSSFTLHCSVAASLAVRETAVLMFLAEKFSLPAFLRITPVDLKTVVKNHVVAGLTAALLGASAAPDSSFTVSLTLRHGATADAVSASQRAAGVANPTQLVQRLVAGTAQLPARPLPAPASSGTVHIGLARSPVYLRGRYLKLARGLPQTPWFIGGERRGSSSVQEEVGLPIARRFKTADTKFHSAGREDADVRMLGDGRPFVLELVDCRHNVAPDALPALQERVNAASDGVEVRGLQLTTKAYFNALQDGADSKRKEYGCVVWVQRGMSPADLAVLDRIHDLTVNQQTPLRVLHRRSLMTRPKVIHSASTEWINAHYFVLRLMTSAGTYVKEFVHGDLGRTDPSVASLLDTEAVILQLDVLDLVYADGIASEQ